jgi:hypothetical protein
LSCPSIQKYSFTSATIAEYFVREIKSTNNGYDTENNEVVFPQKSNLPLELDALASLDTLAATASFDQISLIDLPALSNHWFIGFTDIVGLVGQVISHVGWPTGFVDSVDCNSLSTSEASLASSTSASSIASSASLALMASTASLDLSAYLLWRIVG